MINGARMMLADEFPKIGARGPASRDGSPLRMLLYVDDVDATFTRAIAAGSKLVRPVKTSFTEIGLVDSRLLIEYDHRSARNRHAAVLPVCKKQREFAWAHAMA